MLFAEPEYLRDPQPQTCEGSLRAPPWDRCLKCYSRTSPPPGASKAFAGTEAESLRIELRTSEKARAQAIDPPASPARSYDLPWCQRLMLMLAYA